MLKILHTADWHAEDKNFDEIKKCLLHMTETAEQEMPDLVIVSADLFDSQMVKLDSMAAKLVFEIVSRLSLAAPVAIMVGTPSHEGRATEVLNYIDGGAHNVWVSDKPEQIYLIHGRFTNEPTPYIEEHLQAVISLVPTPTKQFFKSESDIKGTDSEIASAMSGVFAGFGAKAADYTCPHILAGHFSVGGAFVSETQQLVGVDIEINKDQIALAKADLVCLGHIHKAQLIRPNIFYSGSIYRKTWGEMEDKGFYIHTISLEHPDMVDMTGYEVDSNFIRTPTRKLLKIEADMTTEGAFDETDSLLYTYGPDELNEAHLRLEFKIYQDEVDRIDQEQIKRFFLSANVLSVDIQLIRIPRVNIRSKNILKLTTLREKFIERAALTDDTVAESILGKLDTLETTPALDIITNISMGASI